MKIRSSTIVVGAVTAAFITYVILEFTGVVGDKAGTVPAGMMGMLILVLALFARDLWRANAASKVAR